MLRDRMVDRVWFVGSSPDTAPFIEASYKEMLSLVEAHLQERPFLLGSRPAYADFGLSAQIYETLCDPTTGALMRETAPRVCEWSIAMQNPPAEGDYESLESLLPTLLPLLSRELGARFLPWSVANAVAISCGAETMSAELDSGTWVQKPQKYHARSLAAIRAKYAAMDNTSVVDPILAEAGCLDALKG